MNGETRQHNIFPVAQRGAVVLMLLVIITVSTATYFLVHELNNIQLQAERDKINATALARAKDAVLGFALANNDMPGGLPFPDRRETSGTPNYDGNGDCVSSPVGDSHLLGKFPFLYDQGCGPDTRAFDITSTDASGERLWYAVSKKLVKSNGGEYPNITTAELMADNNWLTVNDTNGALLSDKVAFVLISPGGVLQGQGRTGNAPSAQRFLDNYTVGATTYRNWDSNLAFIAARPVNDASNRFNDRLLFVTRSELANRLIFRIANELRQRLGSHHLANGAYPSNLADLGLSGWFANWVPEIGYVATPDSSTFGFINCPAVSFTTSWNGGQNDMQYNGGQCGA